jgi:phosphoribosylglycinamide formyltransferase 1
MPSPTSTPTRFSVLISGRGSNLRAIFEQAKQHKWPAEFVRVISNEPSAAGLQWAQQQNIPISVIPHREYDTREAFDQALAHALETDRPDYVLLAGFMRILTPDLVRKFAGRMVNIHPSLLPAFAGLRTHEQALAARVACHGCTVHFVTDELDHGPIIAQAALAVRSDDTAQTLAQRVLDLEHELYPRVVHWLSRKEVQLQDNGSVSVSAEPRHIWNVV